MPSGEAVHERRLADARRAEQDECLARAKGRPQLLDPLPGHVADGQHGDTERDRLCLRELVGVVEQVELRQDDDRVGAAVPGRHEVALETAHVEVGIEPGEEQDGVDVRGEYVFLRFEPRRLARDLRLAREDRLDRRAVSGRVADGDPVADRGHAAEELVVAELPARVREPLVELGADEIAAAVLRDDAGGAEAALGIWGEGRLELVGPPENGQGSIGQLNFSFTREA